MTTPEVNPEPRDPSTPEQGSANAPGFGTPDPSSSPVDPGYPGYGQARYSGYEQSGYEQPGYGQVGYPGYAQPQPGVPAMYPVARKEPGLMLLASFFIPGLGTILNGETGKGVGILVGYFVALILSVFLIGIPVAIGLWIWGMVDAYQGAERINRANGYL